MSVIEYDNQLKTLVYPTLMFIEMVIKNITLDQLVPGMEDASLDSVYKMGMCDEITNCELRLRRLKLRDRIHGMLSNSYKSKNIMVSHFYNRGDEVPIWAVFEIMMLGD